MKGSPPFPPFQCWKQINIHEAFATLVGGRGGRSTDEKGVFIQTQNIIVSLKALVSVKCLNTFVHDCSLLPRAIVNKYGEALNFLTKMAVHQSRRAAIATILVTVKQDGICEELLGRQKRKKISTNMAGPGIAYQTTTPLLVACFFFRFFRFSHFLAFSVTVVRIFVQIIALLFFTGSGNAVAILH